MTESRAKGRAKIRTRPDVPMPEPQPEPRAPSKRLTQQELNALRFAAKIHFTTDLNGSTVRDMRSLPEFAGVTLKQLDKWCEEDQWIELRHANLNRWRGLIEQRMGQRFVQQQVETLHQMQGLLNQSLVLLMPDTKGNTKVDPGTWEGVASVALRIAKQVTEWREALVDRLPNQIPDGAQQPQQQPEQLMPKRPNMLSPEEAQQMAHIMLQKKMGVAEEHEAESEVEVKDADEPDVAAEG